MRFATTVFICQLSNLLALRGDKKRLKRESSILSRFHFSNFSSFLGDSHLFCEFLSAVIESRIFLNLCVSQGTFFIFIKSGSLKIRCHVPFTVGPGKQGLASFGS